MLGIHYCTKCNFATENAREKWEHEFGNPGHLMRTEIV